jgi:hypothetical protein
MKVDIYLPPSDHIMMTMVAAPKQISTTGVSSYSNFVERWLTQSFS